MRNFIFCCCAFLLCKRFVECSFCDAYERRHNRWSASYRIIRLYHRHSWGEILFWITVIFPFHGRWWMFAVLHLQTVSRSERDVAIWSSFFSVGSNRAVCYWLEQCGKAGDGRREGMPFSVSSYFLPIADEVALQCVGCCQMRFQALW